MAFTIKIAVGPYTGNGAIQNIAVAGGSDAVFTKRVGGTDTLMYTMWHDMPRNACSSLGGTLAVRTGQITDLSRDGFTVGVGQSQNAAPYVYLSIKSLGSNKYFETGRYVGNGADNRDMTGASGCLFTPDLMLLLRHVDGQVQSHRTSEHVGDLSGTFANLAVINYIQNFQAGGFQLGTNANVNNSNDYFNWLTMRQIPNGFKVGSFTGSAAARSIDVGFAPDFVIVKNQDAATIAWMRATGMSLSLPLSATATDAQAITALTSTGFSVGTLADVNGSANKIHYMAFKAGEYTPAGAK